MNEASHCRSRKAFTLIELLVVIAIIAILASILFPVFARTRENARRTSCVSNQKQLSLSFMQYLQDYDERFPSPGKSPDRKMSPWMITMQPYIKDYNILRCPSDTDSRFIDYSGDKMDQVRALEKGTATMIDKDDTCPTGCFARESMTVRLSSYVASDFLEVGKTWNSLAAIQAPANVIYLTESARQNDSTRPLGPDADGYGKNVKSYLYFKASEWKSSGDAWKDGPYDICRASHFDGFTAGYLDGHVKWVKWGQTWQNRTPNAYESGLTTPNFRYAFDPRQQ
jgi:prepilin-type N-terminal cleavage/methylation domain-containing protein